MAFTPSFTGLLPHVSILAQLQQELKAAIKKFQQEIVKGVKNDLDGRRLGSQSYFDKEEIIQKMGVLHAELMRKVDIVGQQSSTAVQACREELDFGSSATEVTLCGGDDQGGASDISALTNTSTTITIVEPSHGKRFMYVYLEGSFSHLHQEFVFPVMILSALIICWFCGNESTRFFSIQAFKGNRDQNCERAL